MLVSKIISLKVVSIWDKKFEGIVENALFDKKNNKLKLLKIYDENSDSTYFIKPADIYAFSSSTILIKNSCVLCLKENLELSSNCCFNPIGSSIYDLNGEDIGIITDLELDNNFKISNIQCCNKTFSLKNFLTLGKNISFLKPNNKTKHSSFSPQKKISIFSKTINVSILDTTNQPIALSPTSLKENNLNKFEKTQNINNFSIETNLNEVSKSNIQPQTSPKRLITDYRFLLNRIITDDIFLSNGEILIRKNSKINSSIIQKARNFGKLIELTQKSK